MTQCRLIVRVVFDQLLRYNNRLLVAALLFTAKVNICLFLVHIWWNRFVYLIMIS